MARTSLVDVSPTLLLCSFQTITQRVGRSQTEARPAKKVCGVFREEVAVKYARIEQLQHQHPVAALSRVMDVSESSYHAWHKRPLSSRQQEALRLKTKIRSAHLRTRETYGPQRLQSDLADHGVVTSLDRIKWIRRKLGLCCKQKRKFKATAFLPVVANAVIMATGSFWPSSSLPSLQTGRRSDGVTRKRSSNWCCRVS